MNIPTKRLLIATRWLTGNHGIFGSLVRGRRCPVLYLTNGRMRALYGEMRAVWPLPFEKRDGPLSVRPRIRRKWCAVSRKGGNRINLRAISRSAGTEAAFFNSFFFLETQRFAVKPNNSATYGQRIPTCVMGS